MAETKPVDKEQKPNRKRRNAWSSPSRYDRKARGEWFVTWLITFLIGLTTIYIALHSFVIRKPTPALNQIVSLEMDGRVTLLDPFALD